MTSTAASKYRPAYKTFTLPKIYINLPRKDLWLSGLILLAGLALPALMVFDFLVPSLLLGFISFALIMLGGILLLVRWGEIA